MFSFYLTFLFSGLVCRGDEGSLIPEVLALQALKKHQSPTGHLFFFATWNVSSEEQDVKMSERWLPKVDGSFLTPSSLGLNVGAAAQ